MNQKPMAVILMGSPSDQPHADRIANALKQMQIETVQRVSSAHKTPRHLLQTLSDFEQNLRPKVYITIAGRSNALSGMVDANVRAPVIACPPPSASFEIADLFSSLRMPSGVAPMVVLDPENAALAAAKILGLASEDIAQSVTRQQKAQRDRLLKSDKGS